jgi:hypothetical protein
MQNEFEINHQMIDRLRRYEKEAAFVDSVLASDESSALVAVRKVINRIESILAPYELRTVAICESFDTIGEAKEAYWALHKSFDVAGYILDKRTGSIVAMIEKNMKSEYHGSPGNFCLDAITTVSGWTDSFAISGRGPNE